MCGRMTQTKKRVPEKHPLAQQVNSAALQPSYNIAPAQPVEGIIKTKRSYCQVLLFLLIISAKSVSIRNSGSIICYLFPGMGITSRCSRASSLLSGSRLRSRHTRSSRPNR
jgi:hypothetical protein